jgi:hypothetical protein
MPGSARTNKAIQSGKAIGISAPANADDNDDTIYRDDDAGYGDAAAHDDRALLEPTRPPNRQGIWHIQASRCR